MTPPRRKHRVAPVLSRNPELTRHRIRFQQSLQGQFGRRCNRAVSIQELMPHVLRLTMAQMLIAHRRGLRASQ